MKERFSKRLSEIRKEVEEFYREKIKSSKEEFVLFKGTHSVSTVLEGDYELSYIQASDVHFDEFGDIVFGNEDDLFVTIGNLDIATLVCIAEEEWEDEFEKAEEGEDNELLDFVVSFEKS